MKRILYLLPFLVLGCESSTPTSPKSTPAERMPTAKIDTSTPPPKEEPKVTPKPPETPKSDEPKTLIESPEPKEEPPEKAPPIPDSYKALNKNKTIFFEKKEDGTRLVHLLANVCLREGPLEVLLCKNNSKEHESILHMEADGREIHFALIAAGAKPGSPVKFQPQYTAASGTKIKISLTYHDKGKLKTVPAGAWIADKKTNKDMAYDWVFAGSRFFKDPERPNADPYYMANNGEFISLANFPDSMLDLPVRSSKDVADLIFEMKTAMIPPLKTPVIVTLEPVIEKEKK